MLKNGRCFVGAGIRLLTREEYIKECREYDNLDEDRLTKGQRFRARWFLWTFLTVAGLLTVLFVGGVTKVIVELL